MKKGLFFLFAALLVVALPLSALAGTQVYRVTDQPYPTNPMTYGLYQTIVPDSCSSQDDPNCKTMMCFAYDPNVRNPAWRFGEPVCISYEGQYNETVRIKTPKGVSPLVGSTDLGWNLVAQGTGYVYSDTTGGDYAVAVSAASVSNPLRMYWAKKPVTASILLSGPFKVEEVVQDDYADAWGIIPTEGEAVELFSKVVSWESLEYVMFHLKIQGNSVLFYKFTAKDGTYCFTDMADMSELCSNQWQ
jgi:hypothetical protein